MYELLGVIGYRLGIEPIITLMTKKEYEMANWCSNNLEITGSDQQIEQIEKLLLNEEGLLDFNALTPMPTES